MYSEEVIKLATTGERPYNRCMCNIEYDSPCPFCKHYVRQSRPRKPGKSGVGVGETDKGFMGIREE